MTTGTAGQPPELDDEAIIEGLAPVAAALGMPADALLALLRAEVQEQRQAADENPRDGYWAEIAFVGHNEYTGYVTEITRNGQPAYRVDFPEKVWGGNPLAYVEYAASAWFSERPRTEASVRRAWGAQVEAAARRAREEARWRAERERRALESGSGDGEPACTCHEDEECEVHQW